MIKMIITTVIITIIIIIMIIMRLYIIIMSRRRFRVNLHSIVVSMSRNSLLETGAISEI